jgi:MFS family permease
VSRQEETLVAGQAAEPHGWEPSQIAALAVVSVAGLMASLTQSLLIPVLPSIAEDVGSSTTIGRAVTGLSLAAIPLGISLISVTLPPRRASSGIALVSAMLGIGGALGLPLAGLIASTATTTCCSGSAWPAAVCPCSAAGSS